MATGGGILTKTVRGEGTRNDGKGKALAMTTGGGGRSRNDARGGRLPAFSTVSARGNLSPVLMLGPKGDKTV